MNSMLLDTDDDPRLTLGACVRMERQSWEVVGLSRPTAGKLQLRLVLAPGRADAVIDLGAFAAS